MIEIRDINGNVRFTTSVNEGCVHTRKLMGDDHIELNFNTEQPVQFERGDYILWQGRRYELTDSTYPTYNPSTGSYTYQLRLDAYYLKWKNKHLFYDRQGNREASWHLTRTPDAHLSIVCSNLKSLGYLYNGKEFTFSIDASVDMSAKVVSYNNTSIIDGLTLIAEKWEAEWWVEDNVIHLGRCEYNTAVSFELGRNVESMTRSESNDNYATRIYAFGSTRNLPANYRKNSNVVVDGVVQKRLMLPVDTPHIDAYPGMPQEKAVEGIVVFEDVYPRRVGTMSSVDGMRFKDTGITFLSKYLMKEELRIVFTSGPLNGMNFGVAFNPDKEDESTPKAQVWEIIPNKDYGKELPDATYKPANGDTYILYGFDITAVSDLYVPAAEKELKERAIAYMAKCKENPSVFDCTMNVIDLIENNLDLNLGDRVKLLNPAYFDAGGYMSRVYGFSKQLDGLKVSYTVGNTAKYSRLASIENEVKEIVYQGNAYQGSGAGVYVIGLNDITTPSERNVFSALRSLEEMDNRSLSRLKDDTAAGHITIEGGLLVKSPVTTREMRSVLSTGLEEEGKNPELLSTTIVEETQQPDVLSKGLVEQAAAASFEGGTLGSLDNVDESYDSLADGKYAFEMRNGTLYPVAAGDFTQSNVMKLTFVSGGVLTVAYGNAAVIAFNFVSTLDEVPTGNGNLTVKVGNRAVYAASIPQGNNHLDVGSFLSIGENAVTVEVTDSYGTTRKLNFSINAVNLTVESTFDATLPITTSSFTYRYTPMGAIQKTVHFVIDGKEAAKMVTPVSNRQLIQTLPAGAHGSHTLEVYTTATIDGNTITSNSLYYDLITVASGKTTPVIASPFRTDSVEQYNTVVIPFSVYNPAATETDVSLLVNGATVSTLRVGRTQQTWNYRLDKAGNVKLEIVCKSVRKAFQLTVTPSTIDVEAETTALELFLPAMGRSNSETNRDKWVYGDTSAELTGFNWSTDGWLPDANGNVALRISGDARVTIPVKPFAGDIRQNGKTIEFEFSTHDVVDYEAVIASCLQAGKGFRITAQSASLSGDITRVETKFKEEERVRISFVIEETAENRLIYTYINGVNSGTKQYVENESFMQAVPQDIVLGSNDCSLNVYNIRVYDNNLNQYQILDNYIADMDDVEKKISLYARNQVYDDYGLLTYEKICRQIPCMTIVGELPAYKGDKKTVSVVYENRLQPEFSFTAGDCQIDVQGTSSQYYPRKNYKTNFKKGFRMTSSGKQTDKYQLTEGVIGASVFCEKADFAESSGTHNTGIANLADEVLKELNLLTPPQLADRKVRTTVSGLPIVIFHQETENTEPQFVGKYNFNTDKAAEETFGFSTAYPNCECWEFRNNTSGRMLFTESEYKRLDSEGNPDWLNDFESRYPDDDNLNAAYKAGKTPAQLKRVTDWVVSCIGNVEKFKAECDSYFNRDNLVFYFMFTELMGMVDQRAKNQFITTWDGQVWYFILYDNDTCLGINNEGEIVFDYNIETHDSLGSQNVWNGAGSELWKLVEQAFGAEITALYTKARQQNILSYERIYAYLNTNQSEKWCESIYNEDGKFKYIDPLTEGYYDYGKDGFIHTGEYLYGLQGSRAEHRKWWLHNRFRYMDSKYNAGQYFGDTATLRLYTPATWAGVQPNADFTLTPYADQYLRVKFGSYVSAAIRGNKSVPGVVAAPEGITFNDTETIIYGASRLKSVGDLSDKYPGSVNMSAATKLEELMIGSSKPGYSNTNLRNVTLESNKLLRKINVENCPGYTSALNLSGCENIREVYAKGSGVTAVVLPSGGVLERLELPGTITNLTLRNQTRLKKSGLVLESTDNISTLWLENTPGIDAVALAEQCRKSGKLERMRLTGINASGDVSTLLNWMELGGLDSNGNDTDTAVVTGIFSVSMITDYQLELFGRVFPDLKIYYNSIVQAPVTTFVLRSNYGRIEETEFTAEGYIVERVNNNAFKVIAQQDGDIINYSFKAKNHKPVSGRYVVAGTRQQEVYATYIPLRTIRVRTNDKNTYPACRITTGGEVYEIKENGYLQIRGFDAVDILVNVPGYPARYETLSAIDMDTTNIVTVLVAVPLTISVCSYLTNSYPYLQNATVEAVNRNTGETCSGSTNMYGHVVLYVSPQHSYDINVKYGKSTSTSSAYIGSNGGSQTVNIDVDINYFRPKENGNIQLLVAAIQGSLTRSISIVSSGSHTIYWGDGSTDTISTGDGINPITLQHSYSDHKILYPLEIDNSESVLSFTYDHLLIAYWSIGNSKIKGLEFKKNSYLRAIGNVFKNDIERKDFEYCFRDCGNLVSIADGLFDKCTNVTNFIYCFFGCSGLTSIPDGLFDLCTNVTEFNGCFYGCFGLTSIPDGLFDQCTKVTYFSGCFYGCSGLASIPDGLFDLCINVRNFSSCFYGCSGLTSIPNGLFDQCTNVYDFRHCFYGCSGLTSIPNGLFGLCNVNDFRYCFYGCSGLTSIPDGLFDLCNVGTFSYCFYGCSGLTSIPDGLFDQCTNVYDFSYCFYGCSGLTSIPDGLFDQCTNVTNFLECFRGCSGLTSIPDGLFDLCTNVILISYCFYGCSGLTSIPDGLFDQCTNVTNFSYCFYGCSGLTSIPDGLFDQCTNATHIGNCFSGCSGLTSIPDGLFDKCTNVTDFGECFRGCSGLTSIPDGLFDKCTNVTDFEYCFFRCSGLTSIPNGLFDLCTKVTNFNGCFSGCSGLTSIPNGLFDQCTNVTNFSYCFSNCSGLTSIPNRLFGLCNVYTFSSCFYGCSGLTSIPNGLFDLCTNVTEFESCFYGCSGLTSIPNGLFDLCTKAENFSICFRDCYGLTSIPDGLFDKCTNITKFYYCFFNCRKINKAILPKTIKNLGWQTYCNCTSLTYIEARTEVPPIIDSTTFENTNNCPIYVPDSAISTYKAASNWLGLRSRIFGISEKTTAQ